MKSDWGSDFSGFSARYAKNRLVGCSASGSCRDLEALCGYRDVEVFRNRREHRVLSDRVDSSDCAVPRRR